MPDSPLAWPGPKIKLQIGLGQNFNGLGRVKPCRDRPATLLVFVIFSCYNILFQHIFTQSPTMTSANSRTLRVSMHLIMQAALIGLTIIILYLPYWIKLWIQVTAIRVKRECPELSTTPHGMTE